MGKMAHRILVWTGRGARRLTAERGGTAPIEFVFPFGGIVLISTIALTLINAHRAAGGEDTGVTFAVALEVLENSLRLLNLSA